MFVGVGASRVRSLFEDAKKQHQPLSLSMIDAVGRQRGVGLGGEMMNANKPSTNSWLKMDGFEGNEGIIVDCSH